MEKGTSCCTLDALLRACWLWEGQMFGAQSVTKRKEGGEVLLRVSVCVAPQMRPIGAPECPYLV